MHTPHDLIPSETKHIAALKTPSKKKNINLINVHRNQKFDGHKGLQKNKRKREELVRCSGTNKDGKPCRNYVRKSKLLCGIHSGNWDASRAAEKERQDKWDQDEYERTVKRKKYKEYINSKDWQKKSRSAKSIYDNRCRLCNREILLHGHHRTYERLGNEIPEDITPLCVECHNMFSWHYKYNSKLNIFLPKVDMTKYDMWKHHK